jgi:hypothetical protein
VAKFTPHIGTQQSADLEESFDASSSFEFSLNVVGHMSAELDEIQASVSELLGKVDWPATISDIQVSLQEAQDDKAEYHMEDHTDTPSRSWAGSVVISTDQPVDSSAMHSQALLIETENLVDDSGNIRFFSLGE